VPINELAQSMSTALKICYSTLVGEGFINTNPPTLFLQ